MDTFAATTSPAHGPASADGTASPGLRAAPAERERLLDIDRAKGLAITLVVLGHLVKSGTLGEQAWYAQLKLAIYAFHMPFFMYLSGFVFFYTGCHLRIGAAYGRLVRQRSLRLLAPFGIMLVLTIVGKTVASHVMYVDEAPRGVGGGLYDAVFATKTSPVFSIWYLWVLFVYSVAFPVLWRLTRGSFPVIAAIALVLHALPVADVLFADRIMGFFIFFVAGCCAAAYRQAILPAMRRYLPLSAVVFVLALGIVTRVPNGWDALLVVGLLSMPALHGLMLSSLVARDRILLAIGSFALAIYLFNTVFIGLAKAVYLKVLPYTGAGFVGLIVVTFIAGLFGPILFKVLVLRRSATLDRFTS
ncbi:hypothetical protein ASF58_00640 [Methylobacterium sp. Leaf125]|uniref:acyltransferase family protein n=1 Tax=Methylobacterium sp. Leaf125 TaxID=1736265 RepID=UPI0006F6AC80|nr:acyltransferase [Methylobacterium sp. Leaf125]KQQ47907.1 hypothetical protein ASF58_00640 [Methylobacterium sp. Leaf125]